MSDLSDVLGQPGAAIEGEDDFEAVIPTFGATKSVTRALKRADGSPAKRVSDFRRS